MLLEAATSTPASLAIRAIKLSPRLLAAVLQPYNKNIRSLGQGLANTLKDFRTQKGRPRQSTGRQEVWRHHARGSKCTELAGLKERQVPYQSDKGITRIFYDKYLGVLAEAER